MKTQQNAAVCTVLAVTLWLAGCSLFYPETRPVPGAQRNLFCAIEYRPDPEFEGPDILFVAAGQPYKVEQVYMNPLDGLVHGLFTPGRYLSAPVAVEGAVCRDPWRAGHRIPSYFAKNHYLLCERTGEEEVRIEVRTRWGECDREIPAGSMEPICGQWNSTLNRGVPLLSPSVCQGSDGGAGE